ncbi:hypothetical protein Tco_0428040, partial [Tanacetum coccineum]
MLKKLLAWIKQRLNVTTVTGEVMIGAIKAEEGPTDFALMAYSSSSSSSSSSSNTKCEALNKSNLEIIGYQMGLESLEARIVVHEKNEAVYEENI